MLWIKVNNQFPFNSIFLIDNHLSMISKYFYIFIYKYHTIYEQKRTLYSLYFSTHLLHPHKYLLPYHPLLPVPLPPVFLLHYPHFHNHPQAHYSLPHPHGSLTATDSLYKPQTLIKTGFLSYFFVNFRATFCSYL